MRPDKKHALVVISALAIVFAVSMFMAHVAPQPVDLQVGSASMNPAVPDRDMTPGVINPAITQATIADTICNPAWSTKSIRPPVSYTTPLKKKQITLYAYTDTNPADYEEDHLISLELGGHPTDPKNLWPEPYNLKYGAHQKDFVENYLHKQVCTGQMTLQMAQYQISSFWPMVYDHIVSPGALGSTVGTIDQDDE